MRGELSVSMGGLRFFLSRPPVRPSHPRPYPHTPLRRTPTLTLQAEGSVATA